MYILYVSKILGSELVNKLMYVTKPVQVHIYIIICLKIEQCNKTKDSAYRIIWSEGDNLLYKPFESKENSL